MHDNIFIFDGQCMYPYMNDYIANYCCQSCLILLMKFNNFMLKCSVNTQILSFQPSLLLD